MDSNTSPIFSRQPSGIRALPSFDDDDDGDIYFSDSSENFNVENINNDNNGSSNVSNLTSFTTPVEKNLGNDVPVSGTLSGLSGRVPIAKVSVEDDEDDIEGSSEDENGGGAGNDGVLSVSTPRARVVNGEGDFKEISSEKDESLAPGVVEKIDSLPSGVGEGGSVVGVVEENGFREMESKGVEEEEVKPTNESSSVDVEERKDPVAEEIFVDAVGIVSSGVVVMGDSGSERVSRDVKEEGVVGENVKLGNEFEPLDGVNVDPVADNVVEFVEREEPKVELVSAEKIERESYLKSEEPLADIEEGEGTHFVEEVEDNGSPVPHEESDVYGEVNDVLSTNATDASRFIDELEQNFEPVEKVDSQIETDTQEEEDDFNEEGDEKEVFDSAALAALLKAATSAGGSDTDTITIASRDGSRLFSIERRAGLGTSLRSLRPASRPSNSSLLTASSLAAPSEKPLSEEDKKKLQHMHQLRVNFLRLVQRLGRSPEDSVSAQVLYRLSLLGGRPTSSAFSLEDAKQTAMELESQGKDDLDFSLTILVLGKAGVGKSATINSIFGEEKVKINAFEPDATFVQEVSGIVDGVKIRVIDAPGLKSSGREQGFNCKVLASVKKLTKKYPPDIMLYVDRLDSQTRDLNDLPLLKTITSSFGSSIWRSAIVTLTHAACTPPDGPSGSPLSYEVFVANHSHMVQQSIGQAVGDLRLMSPSSANPVSLVENHPACRKNQDGQGVLPSGQAWRPQLLLLMYSLKILSDANSSLKPQDPFDTRKLFGFRIRSAPLPYLLSTMLQPRTHPKLTADQGGDNVDSDIDLDDLSDSDQEEEEDEYDQLPPFKPLRKAQIAKLTKDQKKAYFEEYDYRVKLLQRKQWREELKRMREMKKKGKSNMAGYGETLEDFDAENEAPAAVPVPLPDMVLPPSFDSDNPAYRYRFLEPTSQFIARPVLDSHCWDHDCGYDGVNMEQNLRIAGRFPAAVTVQVTKDKKECNIHLDSSVSTKHGQDGSTLLGFDIQTIGKQPACIFRGETKSKLLKKNKTGAGISVTFIGENVATGIKFEDQFHLSKKVLLSGSTGTVRSQKDAVYGANLEVRLRDSEYPIGQDQSSLSLSLMKWRGDLAIGGNLQSQFSIGRSSKVAVRVSLNNKRSGQISVRTSSSDHLQLALAGLIPIVLSIYGYFKPGVSENHSFY